MKLNPRRVMPMACLMLSITFNACKKNSNNDAPPKSVTCVLAGTTSISSGGQSTFSIQRDEKNRISCITLFNGPKVLTQRTFQYYGSEVVITAKNDNGINELDSLTLNAAGDIVRLKISRNNANRPIPDQTLSMLYDANGQLISFTNVNTVYQCVWQNGDLTALINSLDTQRFSYADKPFSIADGQEINRVLEYGQPLFKTAHLCSGYYDHDSIIYNYGFDSNGNVTRVTSRYNAGYSETESIDYDCH